MKTRKISIIGLGNVGQAVVKNIKKYSPLISRRASLKIELKKVCDVNKSKRKIADKFSIPFTANPFDLIRDPEIDTVVELVGGIEPAYSFVKEALKEKKNVITANKALLANKGREIFSLARKVNRRVGFEASVCGAIPLIKSISEGLVSCDIKKLYGILNGTTNYILCQMQKGNIDFNASLAEAQAKGFAERRPGLDINGIDSLHKLSILSYLCYGVWPNLDKVYTEGISKISLLDIRYSAELNYRIKLLAIAKKEKGLLDLRVHPTLVPAEHPLSQTSSAYNAVYCDTSPAGEFLFYGQGAGGPATSSAIISDIVNISSYENGFMRREEKVSFCNTKDLKMRYYVRFMAQDTPGVLAQISKVLATFNISIASVTQKEHKLRKCVPIIMITHEAKEDSIRKALSKINNFKFIKYPSQAIRIEDL
jgi:homoserine dehydrogenase